MSIIQYSSKLDFGHTRPKINSCFLVDDFGVKYFTKDDADHLLDSLKSTMQFQHIGRDEINSD